MYSYAPPTSDCIRALTELVRWISSSPVATLFSLRIRKCGNRLSLALLGCLFFPVSVYNGTGMSVEHKATQHLQSVRAACTAYVGASKTEKESGFIPTINNL